MAGIGFRLQKLLHKDSYSGLVQSYLYSAIISSGPMLSSIICIGLLGALSLPVLTSEDYLIFRTTVVYVFCFSLIFTGLFQMTTTRYVADRLYMEENASLIPCFISLFIITIAGQAVVGSIFFYHVIPDWRYVFVTTMLYIIISCLWNTMIFISATKNYILIFVGFVIGSVTSLIGGQIMGQKLGLLGYLSGFGLGQFIIVVVLTGSFVREFEAFKVIDFNFLRYIRKYPDLFMSGFLINLAVWADKFIFWYSPYGTTIRGLFKSFPLYDSAFFLAYLSIVPALSLFLMRIETGFYSRYKTFYALIMNKASLQTIEASHNEIIRDLKESIFALLKLQGVISVLLIIGAVKVMYAAKLQWMQLVIFKIGVLAAFLLIMFQFLLIILYYFEFRKDALLLTVVFLGTNIAATLFTVQTGIRSFGYGFFSAGFVSLFIGFFILNYRLKNLIFLTFAKQPIMKVKI
ncbi:MAG: hypothetical protein C4541_05855 [Candidatus Auribacter fodinae]|uniref:Uncharacterized protein n=1 Tax=Candidatus Auribacter fodinae TaxID=2093366 RepID=A0A3A4RB68_9BACT|nr:MAG: hypothetical protein C4541_05855 [Candidatus Auribacter fodinae]